MRKYTEELLQGLKDSAVIQMHGDLKMIAKHAPDASEPAAIDPRMINGKMGKMLKIATYRAENFTATITGLEKPD